jgi:hypothetical protein
MTFFTASDLVGNVGNKVILPATDYKNVPSEFGHGGVLRPIPSIIDLPTERELEIDVGNAEVSEKMGSARMSR